MEANSGSETAQTFLERRLRRSSPNGFKTFSYLRNKNLLCDAVLRLEDGGGFPVHRVILSTCSAYFKTLFTTTLNSKEKTDVLLPGVTSKTMTFILDHCYMRKVDINEENVIQLLVSAGYLMMEDLIELCCGFIRSMLVPENCIGIMRFARDHCFPSLEEAARCFVMRNFAQISQKSDELLELPLEELQGLISSDELNVKTEVVVWESVLRWINHDTENRKHHIMKLVKGVRLGLLDSQFFLENIMDHPYFDGHEEAQHILIDILRFLIELELADYKDIEIPTHEFAHPRIPHEILFAIGGITRLNITNSIETYDPRADRWVQINEADMTDSRTHHGTAVIDFNIYVIGGMDGGDELKSCRCYNAVSKTWSEVSPMHVRRCFVSTAVLDGLVYAIGGFDGYSRQKTVERYDHKKNQWTMIAPMNMKRSDAGATALNGKIYVIGGFNGQEFMNSAEVYDPELNEWTLIPRMRFIRSGISCIAYHGHVYTMGGFNGISRMRSGERYNPTTRKWTKIPDMHTKRSNFDTEVIDDKIFVVGGFDGYTTISSVEYFDEMSNEWFEARNMNLSRSGLSVCSMMSLPNVCDYTN
ncbi:Kelch-like protein 10 [Cryptotermes secundus]|uniref:Kelch-like protein diablo n=1 Tax=Cryptotermes secundus TaxID=105785 RepID=A0A2J7R9U5_9NEOP|nr:kelch-like protein 10 [Cryptotermes secundus]PNF37608.1 Kelch-like protein 10 [Cryptotermes secundus]